jgi:hypothetical protein
MANMSQILSNFRERNVRLPFNKTFKELEDAMRIVIAHIERHLLWHPTNSKAWNGR